MSWLAEMGGSFYTRMIHPRGSEGEQVKERHPSGERLADRLREAEVL